jgi:hypothetical protein
MKKHTSTHQKMRESRAPASKNEHFFFIKHIFYTIAKHRACHANARAQIHWWPQVKMHFFRGENRKKRVSPAQNADFESDIWQF